MMKLLIAGLALIALGLALVVLTDLNPAILFIAGVTAAFIAVIRGAAVPDDRVSAGSDADVRSVLDVNP